MKRFLLTLTLIASFVGTAHGFDEDTILKQRDNNGLDFQKVVMEQNLRTKLQAVVGPMFQTAKYELDVSINYKIFKGNRKAMGNDIELDKYGVVAPTISQEALQTDLVSNIGWINVKLIAYDHIAEDKIAMFDDIAKKVVDMVPAWRVRVQIVNPPAPAPAPAPTVDKTIAPYFIGFFFATLALVGVLFFFFKQLQSRRPEAQQETHVHHHAHAAPSQATQKEQPKDVSPEATLVFEAEFREIEPETQQPVEPVQPAVKPAKVTKVPTTISQEPTENVFEMLAQSTPASEKKIFESLRKADKADVLREAATAYFPSELMFNLSPHILTAALDMMPLDDRLGLILCLEGVESAVLVNCLNDKARAYMELELEKNQSNATVKLEIRRNAARYRKTFADSVRQILSSNTDYARLAQPQLEEWLQRKSGGVRDVG